MSEETEKKLSPQEQFAKEYSELCQKHNLQIVGVPEAEFNANKYGEWEQKLVVKLRTVPLR